MSVVECMPGLQKGNRVDSNEADFNLTVQAETKTLLRKIIYAGISTGIHSLMKKTKQ